MVVRKFKNGRYSGIDVTNYEKLLAKWCKCV